MSDTITISRKDFKDTALGILKDTLQDEDLKGQAAFVIPMVKMMVIQELESKLFGEKEEEEKNE